MSSEISATAPATNDLSLYEDVFEGIAPWRGEAPKGFLVDFLGGLTDARFREMWGVDPAAVGGAYTETRLPQLSDGEGWFEAANWCLAAREASGRFVMVTLGACYGAQAVGSYLALQKINPMPCRLVAVEAEPENYQWVIRHFRDNGLDPADHWLLNTAINATNQPVYFPVGSPGSGAQNCYSTDEMSARELYARELSRSGRAEKALKNLLLHNSTGITKDLAPGSGYDFSAEIKCVSAVTLADIVSPFDRVDYLESDIQQSEITVFPPVVDLLKRKVKRIHIGTHGADVHRSLRDMFRDRDWDIVFDFAPDSHYDTPQGKFRTGDGVLTVLNPEL